MAGRTQGGSRSLLARVSKVLGAFTEDETELSAARIAAHTGLARTTNYRLLAELVEFGLLARTAAGRYVIGTRLWELGELSPLSVRLRETALPFLQRLYEVGGENVHLGVLDGEDPALAEALYVARLTGPSSVPTLSRMGSRHPLHTTGVGKALLMTRDEQWLSEYLAKHLERETVYSVTDAQRLRAEITESRARGYATTRQEMTLGSASIAAPVPPVDGLPPAALGIVTHLALSDERGMGALVVRTARDLADALAKIH